MPGLPPGATVHVPDGTEATVALAAATDVGIVAHPDDIELLLAGPLLDCQADPKRSFVGVVVTDGAGSVRSPHHLALSDVEFAAVRAQEQCRAADAAGMGAVVLLAYGSDDVRGTGSARHEVVASIAAVVGAARPVRVHTHDPADTHVTHVAVAAAVIDALRSVGPTGQPEQLLGWEGWRSLAWLPEAYLHRSDLSGRVEEAMDLARHHASQMGPKRYDEAVPGRWRANATFTNPRHLDQSTAVAVAWDLTATLDPRVDPAVALAAVVGQFSGETASPWSSWWGLQ